MRINCHPCEGSVPLRGTRTPNSVYWCRRIVLCVLGPWKSRSGARAVCGLERCATTATACTQGIINAESRARQAIFIVDHAAVEPSEAAGVDKKPRIVSFDDDVIRLRRADGHCVLHAGTASLFDRETKARGFRIETLFFDQRTKLRGGVGGEFNHIPFLGMISHEVK